jgi:hypothetical protein
MPSTVLQIYAAAVCFVSISCLAIALGIVCYSTVTVFNPSFTLHPMSFPPYPPFEVSSSSMDGSPLVGTAPAVSVSPLSDEEAAKRRAAAQETAIHNELANARQSLLRWGIAAGICGILFSVHWRILRRENDRGV